MKTLEEIKNVLTRHKRELERDYNVRRVGVFGSYVKGEQRKKSDVDILVEFKEPVGLFKFMDLEDYLKSLLETKIDLVSEKALKPHIGSYILQEVVYV